MLIGVLVLIAFDPTYAIVIPSSRIQWVSPKAPSSRARRLAACQIQNETAPRAESLVSNLVKEEYHIDTLVPGRGKVLLQQAAYILQAHCLTLVPLGRSPLVGRCIGARVAQDVYKAFALLVGGRGPVAEIRIRGEETADVLDLGRGGGMLC